MSPSALAPRRTRRLGLSDHGPANRAVTGRALADRNPAHLGLAHRAFAHRAPAGRSGARDRIRRLLRDDAGMSTVEYAIGCVAAAAFAAVLYAVVSGDSVVTALTQLVQRALTAGF
jgi:Flp pilus assembly pilin Flp